MLSEHINAITMPKWGLSMKEGKLLGWTVKEGDAIQKGSEIADVETEKIASAIESSVSGILRRIVTEDDTVYPVGALLGIVADDHVSDDQIDLFVEKFQAEFVPGDDDESEESSVSELITVNDLNIHYVSKGESDDIVLLIHGFGGDMGNWLFNHDELVEKAGKRVIALDLPGHGQSTKSVGNGSFDFFADVIYEFIKLLNIKELHLVGHSMGGAISLQFAEKYPEATKSISLICSAGLSQEINSDYLNGFVESHSRKQIKPYLQQLFANKELVTRQLIDGMLQYKRLDGVDELLKKINSSLLDDNKQAVSLIDTLNKINKGCVIWGEKDEIIPVKQLNKINNKNVQVLSIANAGHMVQMEEANKVNQFLIEASLS